MSVVMELAGDTSTRGPILSSGHKQHRLLMPVCHTNVTISP